MGNSVISETPYLSLDVNDGDHYDFGIARLARVVASGFPHHITQRGNRRQQIEALSEDVGPNRSLVIYCMAFRVKKFEDFPNLTIKKIPKTVLHKCEWGKDDYSLEIKNLPSAPKPEPDDSPRPRRRRRRVDDGQPMLFEMEEEH